MLNKCYQLLFRLFLYLLLEDQAQCLHLAGASWISVWQGSEWVSRTLHSFVHESPCMWNRETRLLPILWGLVGVHEMWQCLGNGEVSLPTVERLPLCYRGCRYKWPGVSGLPAWDLAWEYGHSGKDKEIRNGLTGTSHLQNVSLRQVLRVLSPLQVTCMFQGALLWKNVGKTFY